MNLTQKQPTTRTHTLANGLTIIGERINWVKGAAIGFVVKTGARDEIAAVSGVSHFLEHMLFKGTKKRTSIQLSYDMGAIGAMANAFTSEEQTVYYASVLGEYVPQMQEILCDMLRSTLPGEEFDMEKKVILEEIALYQDRPAFWLFEQASQHFFQDHPAGNSVLGTNESISALTRDQMFNYLQERYSPSNMVLVATGNIDWDAVCKSAEEYCGSWENFPASRDAFPYSRPSDMVIYRKPQVTQAHILFVSPGCSVQDDHRYALRVLSVIIGDSMGSRMYWELIDSGLAESAEADNENRDGVGTFSFYASTRVADLDKVRTKIKAIIMSLEDFSDEDLERAKNKILARIVMSEESPMGRMLALGQTWNYLKKIHKVEEAAEKIANVDRGSIKEALQTYPLREWCEYQLLPEV
jgi:predicted Zn-dependent peptidase